MGRLRFLLHAVAGGVTILFAVTVLDGFGRMFLFDPGPGFWNGGYELEEIVAGLLANGLTALAPVIGGAFAGFLWNDGPMAGAIIGTFSGALVWIPTMWAFGGLWASTFRFFMDPSYFSFYFGGVGTGAVIVLGTINLMGGAALGGYLASPAEPVQL